MDVKIIFLNDDLEEYIYIYIYIYGDCVIICLYVDDKLIFVTSLDIVHQKKSFPLFLLNLI